MIFWLLGFSRTDGRGVMNVCGRVLVLTGGHSFDQGAFSDMMDSACGTIGWTWTQSEHPEAEALLHPGHAGEWDAILFYDLPGLQLARGAEPVAVEPSEVLKAGVRELVDAGQGFVALHHALAGWPTWDAWAQLLGGRFLYAPGTFEGVAAPPSGYRMDRYLVEPMQDQHPVCVGVGAFELIDELYLCPLLDHDIVPLLRTSSSTEAKHMIDAYSEVLVGERRPAAAQPSSEYLGWATTAGKSRTVYLLPGHTPETMGNRMFRKLIANALMYVSSLGVDEA